MVEKGTRGGICHSICHLSIWKSWKIYVKDYDKNKELSYIPYWDVNNLYDWAISQNLLGNNFQLIKDTFQLN